LTYPSNGGEQDYGKSTMGRGSARGGLLARVDKVASQIRIKSPYSLKKKKVEEGEGEAPSSQVRGRVHAAHRIRRRKGGHLKEIGKGNPDHTS